MNQEIKSIDYNLSTDEKLECQVILSYLSELLFSDVNNFSNEFLEEDGSYVKIAKGNDKNNSYNCVVFVPDSESKCKSISIPNDTNETNYKEWTGEGSIINIEEGFINYALRGPAKLSVNLVNGEVDMSVFSDGNYEVTLIDRMRFMAMYIVNQYRLDNNT